MTTFTRSWDATYESKPDDDNFGYEIDNYIRQVIVDVRERLEIDHIWKIGATDGEHKKVTLAPLATKPTLPGASYGAIYTKTASGAVELFYEDSDGTEVQLTSGGILSVIPAGTKMWFYADAAPTGWTIDSTPSDALVGIKGGSTYTTGGALAGTWTQTHTHTFTHTHTVGYTTSYQVYGNDLYGNQLTTNQNHTHTTDSQSTATSGAPSQYLRPYSAVGIICTKD